MSIQFPGEYGGESGEMRPARRSLPSWHRPVQERCFVRDGELFCFCGGCEPPPPIPIEEYPEHIRGWTAQHRPSAQ